MKYLESAIRFLIKYWVLAIPLFILTAIPALLSGTGSALATLGNLAALRDPYGLQQDPARILSLTGPIVLAVVGGSFLAFVFQFASIPATYGLIGKGLDTGKADLGDIGQAISQNFVKYILYWVGQIVVWLAFSVASIILILIISLLSAIIKPIAVILFILLSLVLLIAGIVIMILISLWFPAMVTDNLDVVAAVKKSIEVAKQSFWTILGIGILIGIAGAIAGGILGLLSPIPLLGPIIASAVPTATGFVWAVFALLLYRERTGKANLVEGI